MGTNLGQDLGSAYQTITGRFISLSNCTDAESAFLAKLARKYTRKQDWTRFAAWWNSEFHAAGLDMSSVLYRVCQDLEARLGINQGKVSPPDYRDFLAELIDTQFATRQEFCDATEIDPGQLSRVLAGRSDLSLKVLQKALEVLHAQLVVQPEDESRMQSSVERAADALTRAVVAGHSGAVSANPEAA